MIVVLDTNIFLSDLSLNSQRLSVLEEYALKTGSSFAMPRIVLEELLANYRRRLEESIRKAKSLRNSLNELLLIGEVPDFRVSIDDEVAAYKSRVFERFVFDDTSIVEYGADYLSLVLNRAVNRLPPCSAKGEEIRDAVLWLTLLDIAKIDEDKTVLFISEDRSAFADAPDVLKSELALECAEQNVTIRYFTSLQNFAEALAVKLDFIDEQWIRSAVPLDQVVVRGKAAIEEAAERSLAWRDFKRDKHWEPTGYFKQVSHEITLDHFFVNELGDDRFRIEVVYSGEVEVECEVSGESEIPGEPGQWTYNAALDDMEFEVGVPPRWQSFSEVVYVYPYVTITVEIVVHEQVVVSWKVIDLDT